MYRDRIKQKASQLNDISIDLHDIINSDMDPEAKFDAIFPEYVKEVKSIIPNFDWYDPGTTYEEDVKAFIDAVDNEILNCKKFLKNDR